MMSGVEEEGDEERVEMVWYEEDGVMKQGRLDDVDTTA